MIESMMQDREMAKNTNFKYSVGYTSGATGFGWEDKCETIKDVELLIDDIRKVNNAYVTVFDNQLNDFIFFKQALDIPSIDLLHNYKRDLRTTTRKRKL